MRERLRVLFDHDLSLAAYHLALDAHEEVGNNALLCRELGVEPEARCFVTGEAAEPTKHAAKEAGIHFVAAGHYATETFGVRALAQRIADELAVEWELVDLPNPV